MKPRHAISLVLPILHICLCVAVATGVFGSDGSWPWFLVFFVDFPFSILLLLLLNRLNIANPFAVFVLLGTAWWYLITHWSGLHSRRRSAL